MQLPERCYLDSAVVIVILLGLKAKESSIYNVFLGDISGSYRKKKTPLSSSKLHKSYKELKGQSFKYSIKYCFHWHPF